MKKALAIFLSILMLTGCGQTAPRSEKTDSNEPVVVLSADDSLPPVPIKATTPAEAESPAAELVAPAAFIPDNLFILSNGTALRINGSESFTEEDIRSAAETISATAFDGLRQTAVFYNETQHDAWLETLYEQYASNQYPKLSNDKLMVLESEVLPDVSSRINRLCAPGSDISSLAPDLAAQITNYFRLKLTDYNESYAGIGCTLGSSDRVKNEWLLWADAFAEQESIVGAEFIRVDSDADIRSITEMNDILIIGVQEQFRIDYRYPEHTEVLQMAFATNHVMILQPSDKDYQVIRDFYTCPILNLDTSEGIDRYVPAIAESLIWLMSYQEETGEWKPATYLWAR